MLFDVDTKGITDDVCDRVAEAGGYWNVLVDVCPALGKAAHVIRASTTAGLVNTATGGAYEGSGGLHIYTLIQDGADIPRFIETLANRLWLAGYGWILISKAGSLLQRTIIDVAVSSPERLVFEGGPTLGEGLRQDKEARRARVHDGECLDTVGACHDLTVGEEARLGAIVAQAKTQKHGESKRIRAIWVERTVAETVERTGRSAHDVRKEITNTFAGRLTPDFTLYFDDYGAVTVREVLKDPDKFIGEGLADPHEPEEYDHNRAKLFPAITMAGSSSRATRTAA